jgi:hypothetical protein
MATDPQILKKLTEDLDNLNDVIDDISKEIQNNLNKQLAVTSTEINSMVDSLEKGEDVTKKVASAFKKAQSENRKLGLDQNRLQAQLLEINEQLTRKYNKELKIKKDSLTAQIQDNKLQQQLNDSVLDYLRTLSSAAEEEKKITEEKKKQNTLSGFVAAKYKEIKGQLETFFSLGSIFKIILDGALRFSKISTEIGKNLGYGADNANKVASNMIDVAQSANNVNVTFQNLADAANELSTATGYVAEYSADTLETQIMLTKQFGLQAEEAAGIYKLSVLTGKSSKAVNDAMVGAFAATRNQLKVGVPFKATIAEAAKVSGQLAANLQNNPALITKAVVQAKALGTTLEQVKGQGEALLNFESSLENELKAELLTGKQLNLERARAAALAGDQVALAEELNKNVGTLEDFQKMNVLQQKSLAEAVGLTSDQLADQLRNQKIALETGKSLAEVNADELKQAQERQNVQDKFNQAILKLQDFFGNLLAGPLGQFLEFLSKSLDYVTAIGAGLVAWKVASKAVAFYQNVVTLSKQKEIGFGNALLMQSKAQLGIDTADATAKITGQAALSWGAIIPIVLGAAATAYSLFSSFKADDLMSESGYGKRTLLAPEGAFKLNDNDTVIAGTDLGGGGGMSGGSIDLTPMIAAINEVKIAVNQLMNRPVIVTMDSKQVGSSLVQASPKSA